MKQKLSLLIFLMFFWFSPGMSNPNSLKMSDVPRVIERLFSLHIENKELTPTLVRRSMKLYIEQFDPEKAYLLDSEAAAFLNLSDRKAKEIVDRMSRQDYSDFLKLNRVIQNAIVRAQSIRAALFDQLIQSDLEGDNSNFSAHSKFASSEEEVMLRQKSRMVRFYSFHKIRTPLDTVERKSKVYTLFERKVRRSEYNYLFLSAEGFQLSNDRIEHLTALRIVKAFAKSLDTHTSFFSPEEAYEMRMSLEKQFEGVGVVLSEGIDGVMIAELIKGSPAEQSGMIPQGSEGIYSPLPPPSCFSLANTALTSSSSAGFFATGAAGAGSGSSFGAVVTEAGRRVAPCCSAGAGFSLAAFITSRSRSVCEQRPSVTGSSGVRFAEFQ